MTEATELKTGDRAREKAVLAYLDETDPQAAAVARERYGCLTQWANDPATYGRAVLTEGYRKCEKLVVEQCRELLERCLNYVARDVRLAADAKADYLKALQEQFRDRRFDREDLGLLGYAGAEFVLVGAREDPGRTYDIGLNAEREDYGHSDTLRKLRLTKSRAPIRPLVEGKRE